MPKKSKKLAKKPKIAPPIQQPINWAYETKQYGFAFIVVSAVFAFLSWYLFARRGYYDLYIANKVMAGTAAVVFSLILMIGTGSRLFSFPDRFMQYRKELGIISFFLTLAHVLVSMFFLPDRFPLSRFIGQVNWPFYYGLAGTAILIILFITSFKSVINALGVKVWWPLQYWGLRLVFLATALHVVVMKMRFWVSWYQKGGGADLMRPDWPAAGILVGWFMSAAFLIRVSELFGSKFSKFIWYFTWVLLVTIYYLSFVWGGQFAK